MKTVLKLFGGALAISAWSLVMGVAVYTLLWVGGKFLAYELTIDLFKSLNG
jgi:hypothetical protein